MRRGILWGEEITTRPTYGSPMRALGPLVEKARRLPPIVLDGAIGAGIFALGALGQLATPSSGISPSDALPHSQRPAALGLLALASLGAALRRTNLLAACVLVLLAAFGGLFAWNDAWGNNLPELALLYTVSERRGLGASLLALVASALLPFVVQHHRAVQVGAPFFPYLPATIEGSAPSLIMVWFAGRAQARRRAIATELGRGVGQLNEEREWLARSAVAAERSRIARDLHALVVRGIEAMSAETRVAQALLADAPSRASESVAAIESTGRATLVEMRRLLLVLRTRDAAGASSPDVAPTGLLLAGSRDGEGPRSSLPSMSAAPLRLGQTISKRVRRWIGIPSVANGLLVVLLAVMAVTEPFIVSWAGPPWPYVPLAILVVGVLLLRRRFPVAALAVVAVEVFAWNVFLGGTPATVDRSMLVAVFSVAALRGLRWGIVALGAQVVGYSPLIFAMFGRPQLLWPYDLAGWSSLFLFAVIGGMAVRNATRLNGELHDQTELLHQTREERVRLAVDEERTRIARDVHDMVAHGVTLMVIQAGAARWLAESDPLQADRALSAVERAGQEALREVHSLVGSLDGTPMVPEPFPTGEQLTIRSLVDHELEGGMHVELVVHGEPRPLDPGLEVSLYRITQEALTNVRKHAPGARAWVELRYGPEGVEVEVTDAGGRTAVGPLTLPGAGQGLVGIAERAALFGGRAKAGPTPQGGFIVRATLHEERVLV
jgi:signal transduction histidine kinase